MSLNAQSSRAKLELLPGYSDVFDVMFDSVKIEGLPVEAEEDSDEMDSDFSDDEQDEDGLGDDEYLNLPTNHGVPCDQCVRFVAKDPTAATNHHLKLEEMVMSPSRYALSDGDIVHIRSCLLGFFYLHLESSYGD